MEVRKRTSSDAVIEKCLIPKHSLNRNNKNGYQKCPAISIKYYIVSFVIKLIGSTISDF